MVNIAREPDTEPTLTLHDVMLSINSVRAQIDEIGGQAAAIVTKTDLTSAVSGLATADELEAAVSMLKTTVNREAEDLGESISSLTNMVAKQLGSKADLAQA